MRGLAVLLLVSFHVIGATSDAGLQLDYPHPLRVFADLLIDLRMPLFAFIAGYVYGLRPIQLGQYGSFVSGKFKRLAVPGSIAMLIFAFLSTMAGRESFAVGAGDLCRIFVFPYAHYWFLQAILLIFLLHGLIEIGTGNRGTPLLLGMACAIFLWPVFPPPCFRSIRLCCCFPFIFWAWPFCVIATG
ncbi:acyltransferase family protein [Paracoccus actinidiae]|uniref:acyltransferase family protein n=1 Tax=Paracoccus actinidiae TaxID=3064531 RepID=UPI0027D21643|nr:acyltransferase family protein [Paracoccus sp. M09]